MGKIYNIVLNSENGSGANVNSKTFYFDWGRIPDGQYVVSFTLQSSGMTTVGTFQPLIYIDLGSGSNNFTVGSSGTVNNPNFLGQLQITAVGVNQSYFANSTTNTLLYLDCKPTKNNFTVEIYSNANPQVLYTTPAFVRYTLVLNFELQD